jgi:hypothetical protein
MGPAAAFGATGPAAAGTNCAVAVHAAATTLAINELPSSILRWAVFAQQHACRSLLHPPAKQQDHAPAKATVLSHHRTYRPEGLTCRAGWLEPLMFCGKHATNMMMQRGQIGVVLEQG